MDRIAKISTDTAFLELLQKINALEKDRIFCRHGIDHLLDVARIAWIDVLENGYALAKPVVYAAALLHDIGRANGKERHDVSGLPQIRNILQANSFSEMEIQMICEAIAGHRNDDTSRQNTLLAEVLLRADKRSRLCFICEAAQNCYWPEEKRNHAVTV